MVFVNVCDTLEQHVDEIHSDVEEESHKCPCFGQICSDSFHPRAISICVILY